MLKSKILKRFKSILFKNSIPFRVLDEPETSSSTLLLEAGNCLREGRKNRGLTLRDLAIQTRISTTVLEAIENGWIDRLPEAAYLAAMIPLLESHLRLRPGSLNGAIKSLQTHQNNQWKNRPKRFTPGNIEVLTTWQGSIAYVLVILVSTVALNYQHKTMFNKGNSPMTNISADLYPLTDSEYSIIKDVRPLVKANNLLPRNWLGLISPRGVGILKINTFEARSLSLRSGFESEIIIEGFNGKMLLKLRPPISIEVKPPLTKEESINWDGQPLSHTPERPGNYIIE